MASNFLFSTRDHKFILNEWLDTEKVLNLEHFKDYYSMDMIDEILDSALKVAKEVVAPTRDDCGEMGVQFKDGQVITPESFKKAYFFLNDNGWGCSNEDHELEGAMPQIIYRACGEMFAGAHTGFLPYLLSTSGSAGLVSSFGSERVRSIFKDKMFSGQWGGTMCLTEPSAGSDVGDLLTRAYPTDDPEIWKIRGSKCFITSGQHDMTENIVHLVLARCEGGRPGTAGISLFAVPRERVNDAGEIVGFNDVNCIGIEHKMGIRGSSTAVLTFGDENDCLGYILGQAPGEDGRGQGMAQMFQMMNGARMETGHAALSEVVVAYHNACSYASERIQGRSITDPKGERKTIIKHEDVRRMLLDLKAYMEGMRALIFQTYWYFDMVEHSDDPEEKKKYQGMLEVNTPIVKAYISDRSWELCAEAMQVFGGNGFSEEYPIAELCRDVKIYSIWEGTNYIQAMDLIGRKWMMGKGAVFANWLAEIEAFADANAGAAGLEREFELLKQAVGSYREIQMTMGGYLGAGKMNMLPLYATRIQHATGDLICTQLLLSQALVAQAKIKEFGEEHYDYPYYNGKVNSARYFARNILPHVFNTLEVIKEGDTSVIDIDERAFLDF